MLARDRRGEESSLLLKYQYRELTSPRSIRLLKLDKKFDLSGKTPYQTQLLEYKLDACPPFTAVSYVWGDPADVVSIGCEGKSLSITKSCNGALRRLVRSYRPPLVWVDAICINQADNREKSTQVAMMCDIYTTASHVMVWLGRGNSAAKEGMRRLQRCSLVHSLALWEGPFRQWRRQKYMQYIERGFQDQTGKYGELLRGTVGEVLSHEWFERLWTLQEAALPNPNQVALYCGSKRVRLNPVMDFADFAMGKDPRINSYLFGQAMMYCASLFTIHYAKLGNRGPENPFRLLIASSQKHASHPADYVFATYGLAVNNGLKPPLPDYSKTTSEVFTEITRYCIEYENKLGIISIAGGGLEHSLPSWVPDFSVADYSSAAGDYRASLSSPHIYSFDTSGRQLKVKGIFLERVSTVGPALPLLKGVASPRFHALKDDFLQTFKVAIPAWVDLAKQNRKSGMSEQEIMDKLAWTLYLEERTSDEDLATVDLDDLLWLLQNSTSLSAEYARQLDFVVTMLASRLSGRRFFLTSSGRMGLGPERCEPGDFVALLSGLRLPFIIRQKSSGSELLGWTFVYGVMSGQAWPDESLLQDITIM